MTEHRAGTGTSIVAGQPLDDRERPEIDTSLPHSARVYDHWLGPKAARYWAGVARKP
ncbi:SAM-dependent methyltransferase [Streptomyces sp. NRRL B-24484]|uniref:SAM-dependent methyltransferase n=1 Tax=Streptomyces sp. NRRL B-24484 TaxID=1463833 RepID=UPI000A9E8F76|nr:SAM-dependent methyltransferase [Streptomyces sp. NRRL B-24484]